MTAADQDKTPKGKTAKPIAAITVVSRSPRGSMFRAGREWPAEEVTEPVAAFSASQLEALRAEPLLVVRDTFIDAAAPQDAPA